MITPGLVPTGSSTKGTTAEAPGGRIISSSPTEPSGKRTVSRSRLRTRPVWRRREDRRDINKQEKGEWKKGRGVGKPLETPPPGDRTLDGLSGEILELQHRIVRYRTRLGG